MDRTLLIFIKNPIPGKTKTRLAAEVGNDRALRMYDQLLTYTRGVAEAVRARRMLYYSETILSNDGWSDTHFEKYVQEGTDLGARMEKAFVRAFEQSNRVLIIGSDCPGISAALLEEAFNALDAADMVLGPALDGGYYLLGLRKLQPALFHDMVWSTDRVAAETLGRAAKLGLRVHQLVPLSDVDYLEDWVRYGWEVPK